MNKMAYICILAATTTSITQTMHDNNAQVGAAAAAAAQANPLMPDPAAFAPAQYISESKEAKAGHKLYELKRAYTSLIKLNPLHHPKYKQRAEALLRNCLYIQETYGHMYPEILRETTRIAAGLR